MQYRVDFVGNSRAPVIVIDNAWPHPETLVEIAACKTDYSSRSLYYPGVRSNAPADYAHALVSSLREPIRSTFGISAALTITDASFSIVLTPPEKLVPFQRVPHFDSADPNRFAALHYLCATERGGGTSFYRHRSTGREIVTPDTHDAYIRAVNAEVKAKGMPPAQYPEGDTELFERIAKYDAVFNRVLVYRGSMLHSVNVPPEFVPDPNPRTGRLTLNTFLLAGAAA